MTNNIAILNEVKISNHHYDYLTKIYHENIETKQAFYEFFGARIRNKNTRTAYLYSVRSFFEWAEQYGVTKPEQVNALIVSKWVDNQLEVMSVPTVKQRLAGLKMLFDWLVVRNILSTNPISSVKTPRYSVNIGKTPHLAAHEARQLLDTIDVSTIKGLRDRALIALMTYTFARIGAALKLKHEDLYWQEGRLWVRLSEKGGRTHALPCHHKLEQWMQEYLVCRAYNQSKTPFVFVTIDRKTKALSDCPLSQSNAYVMVRKRAKEAGIKTQICNHTFRATGITTFLENNGTLERAARIANHASTRTTQLYDRRSRKILQKDVEKIDL